MGGIGKFTIAGRVVDVEGNAVVDAEVMVAMTVVYTGANGEFELTVGKRKAYAVVVEGWKAVSGAEIASGEPDDCCGSLKMRSVGCMVCKRDNKPDGGLGMCTRCYSREFQLRKNLLRELIEAYDAGHKI